jgi:integrase/recombinase XerD
MSVTIDIYFDTRTFRKKTQDYPFKLKVYYQKDTRNFLTVYGLSATDEKKLVSPRLGTELQRVKDSLAELRRTAETFASDMRPFNFDDFIQDFLKDNPHIDQTRIKLPEAKPADQEFDYKPYHKKFPILLETPEAGTIGQVFLSIIQYKILIGKVTTALLYQQAYTSLKKFGGNATFQKVTHKYLHAYGEWMKSQGNSKTTTGIYLRNLRGVFNEAETLKIIKKETCYPFGKKKYRIPGTRNVKKAYEVEEIQKVYHYQCDPEKPWLQRAKDFVLFIVFGKGLNPLDICQLQRKHVVEGLISFERGKTEETSKEDPPKIVIVIDDTIGPIIDRQCLKDKHGNPVMDPESYLFPIFVHGMNPLEQYERRQLFIEFVNKWFTYILADVGVNKPGRCYDLRHTYATVQILGGADLNQIQEDLGQQDPRTTRRYVASLPITYKKLAAARMDILKQEPLEDEG